MIRILALLVALLAPGIAHAQVSATVYCFNPSGGSGSQWQPCQYSNAAPVANLVSGAGNTTGTGATTIIAAQAAGIKMYISSLQCFRTDAGTTAIFATLNDGASTIIGIPNGGGGGGNNIVFQIPLVVAAATALTFTASGGVTTLYCNAQGYQGK
jgi:hypothetical protein